MLGEPFTKARNVIQTLEDNGYEAYFVGGSVRDYLLNVPIGDIDIATNAKPDEMLKLFKRTVPVGIEHGTVLILDGEHEFEVTTYRVEGEYDDFRRPDSVEFVRDITLDLSRRDFTINAMAMSLDGDIIDPYGGQEHLLQKEIHTVGQPKDRFTEDALRMLRAVRFASQLNFKIAHDVNEAIKEYGSLIKYVAVERIQVELFKMFKGVGLKQGLHSLNMTQLYKSLPLFKGEHSLVRSLIETVQDPIPFENVVIATLSLLSKDHDLNDWVKAYKLSNKLKRESLHVLHCYDEYKRKGISETLVYHVTHDYFVHFLELVFIIDREKIETSELTTLFEQLPIQSRSDLAVTGHDLMNMFPSVRKGPWIGEYLSKIEQLVLQGKLKNNRTEIESQVKRWKEQESN
ncbi:tRNA nucleotidyltransferase (CCA-adding enzyme) [Alkalibacillus filiformis]|uniref:CCA-adding enzyme n=1 Tax=Alkalibacillus filiformis TaxID=200990 RepID=A0ABU0DQW3_9BACI|nr:CCA tRNA nucleotidyltransferase [Alkalibacillus filiformis]MDQ0350838.1 tRNA nucleotidyltransferase (CCA-adding enzyme) [Alkalibacillus filiformis]